MTTVGDPQVPETLYGALLAKFKRLGFSHAVADDLADRAEDVARAWMAASRPSRVWYSICSAHAEYDDSCLRCRVGSWVDESDPAVIADRALWESDPDAWRVAHAHTHTAITELEQREPADAGYPTALADLLAEAMGLWDEAGTQDPGEPEADPSLQECVENDWNLAAFLALYLQRRGVDIA